MPFPVLILCATRREMGEFLARRGIPYESGRLTPGGICRFDGPDADWELVISGPGVCNAAMALTACLERRRPRWVLHTGIAGVFEAAGLVPGDVAVATTETYVHAGVELPARAHDPLEKMSRILLDPLPFDLVDGNETTRKGHYVLDPALSAACKRTLSRFLGQRVTQGGFITVSTITGSTETANGLHHAFSPVMEAMEGAAAAHVAARYQVPFVEVRAGSNRVGDRDRGRWEMDRAVRAVADLCDILLDRDTPWNPGDPA